MRGLATYTCILVLTACTTIVEHARLDLAEDLSSNLQLLLSDHYEPSTADSEQTREDEFKTYIRESKACGASTRMFYEEKTKRLYLQLNASAKTRDELDVLVRCAGVRKNLPKLPKLAISTDDGLLSKRVITSFSMQSGFMMSGNYPREFTLTVPGRIKEIRNSSKMLFYTVSESRPSENVFRFEIDSRKDSFTKEERARIEAMNRRMCGNRDLKDCNPKEEDLPDELRYSEVNYTVVSEKPKYDLNAGLALLGVLFGSGIVFQLASHFRKTK